MNNGPKSKNVSSNTFKLDKNVTHFSSYKIIQKERDGEKLTEDEILSQSKMMAIADIYDALTAADRPYKKAIPIEKALSILKMEVDRRHLDEELTRMFIDGKVFRAAENY